MNSEQEKQALRGTVGETDTPPSHVVQETTNMGSDDIITSDGSNVEDPAACVGGADLSVNQVRVESSDDSTSTVIRGGHFATNRANGGV